jgi:tRNA (guanine10-N2)-dimethyltransferase
MVRRSCLLLTESSKAPSDILQAIAGLDLKVLLKAQRSFAVRVKGIKEHARGVNLAQLEGEIGALIKGRIHQIPVDLENPELLFYVIVTSDKALICLNVAEAEEKGFTQRRPGFRSFFHPTSMHPRLARAMVNLSGAKPGSIFLDPFCGSGGLLIEAGVIGCGAIGMDIDLQMAEGSERNIRQFGLHLANICAGDARKMPFREVDSIATDPPYGRSSSTKGEDTPTLVEEFLEEVTPMLKTRKRVCLSVPSTVDVNSLTSKDLQLVQAHLARVHRSLTRIIAIFERG